MTDFYAHSKNEKGELHSLVDHLNGTASKAKFFASKWGLGGWAEILGLVHDLGKYSKEFQDYLLREGNSVEHAISGAVYLKEEVDLDISEILAVPIAGHHSGLHNLGDLQTIVSTKSNYNFVKESIKNYKNKFTNDLKNDEKIPDIDFNNPLAVEFLIRMLFSALVDADFLDTEKHFNEEKFFIRKNYSYDLSSLWKNFKSDQNRLQEKAENTFINKIRNEIYRTAVEKADIKNNFFSLTVPTGGGKTRTGLGFGLKHAVSNNMDRIIVVIPYTNIIEQTAKEYRNILGEDNVLEHHSNIDYQSDDKERENRNKLAAENWDMPIIVTTAVQFFESLFAIKVSRKRKIHNIANSVIILDEVQTLPPGFLKTIIQALKQLVNNYNSSIIFSTATQPAFKTRSKFEGINNIEEIAPQPEKIYNQLKRVKFDFLEQELSWEEVVNKMREKKQALVVLNTRDDAREVFSRLEENDAQNVYHLSTYMCAKHRSKILDEVKLKLRQKQECYLVSTQLIEAGVDIDFPLVLRAIGPLDSIVQAAGRCNREGKLDSGEVIIFEPEELKLPQGIYKTATEKTKVFLHDCKTLQDPDIFYDYFNRLYSDVNLDKKNIQELRKNLSFREVAARFKIIPDDTVNVIIENSRIVGELPVDLNIIKNKGFIERNEWRKLQPYLVSLRKYKVNELLNEGLINEIVDNIYVWTGKYDENQGIKEEYTYSDFTISRG